MRLINLVIAACILLVFLGGINTLLLRLLHPGWWKMRAVRFTSGLLPIVSVIFTISWGVGFSRSLTALVAFGAVATPVAFILNVALVVSLLISGLVYSVARIVDCVERVRSAVEKPAVPGRRRFIKATTAVFPAAAMTSSFAGVVDSYADITVPVRRIPVADLPDSLEGLKIAHLSDSHLGYYVHLDAVQGAVEKIRSHDPDLVLYTGDISDNLNILADAIDIVNQLKPRYGIYASVGNHEYYRGIKRVREIFEKAPFPMLIEHHVNIDIGETTIFLGGANDPQTLSKDYTQFLIGTIEDTMGQAPRDVFKLLMCHRPEGFNYSAVRGINLVLSGHTHGGQLGIAGRSALEPIFPGKYMWGTYRRGKTTLFTSGGMGHWFPFRLGVPAEAPILILEKG